MCVCVRLIRNAIYGSSGYSTPIVIDAAFIAHRLVYYASAVSILTHHPDHHRPRPITRIFPRIFLHSLTFHLGIFFVL